MKHIRTSLIYLIYLFASSWVGFAINMLIDIIVRTVAAFKTPFDNAALISTLIVMNIVPWIVLFIIMYQSGYRKNNGYEKTSRQDIAIVIGIAFLINLFINIIFGFRFILDMRGMVNAPNLAFFIEMAVYNIKNANVTPGDLPVDVELVLSWGSMIVSYVIQLLLCAPVIAGGFYLGYRRRGQERYDLLREDSDDKK